MLKPEVDEDVVQECWFGDFSPWQSGLNAARAQLFLWDFSQCVRHEVAECFLKCREHHVLHRKCLSREMPHTHATEDTSSVNPSLELTS